MERISHIHHDLSREELTDGIKRLREEIREYQTEYDASDPDDLAFQIESDNAEAWSVVAAWRSAETDLNIAKAALALYDFDPDAGDGEGTSSTDGTDSESSSRGSLSAQSASV